MVQPIKIIRGTSKIIYLSLTDQDGSSRSLESGESLFMGVKLDPSESSYIFKISCDEAGDTGDFEFEITPSMTESQNFGRYYYDVGLVSGDNYFSVIECSPFDICYNITKLGDEP